MKGFTHSVLCLSYIKSNFVRAYRESRGSRPMILHCVQGAEGKTIGKCCVHTFWIVPYEFFLHIIFIILCIKTDKFSEQLKKERGSKLKIHFRRFSFLTSLVIYPFFDRAITKEDYVVPKHLRNFDKASSMFFSYSRPYLATIMNIPGPFKGSFNG